MGSSRQTSLINPFAKFSEGTGGLGCHYKEALPGTISVLGLGEDLRVEAESQVTAHFPGDGQMLSQGTQGLRIRTRVPKGPHFRVQGTLKQPGAPRGLDPYTAAPPGLSFGSSLLLHLPKELLS